MPLDRDGLAGAWSSTPGHGCVKSTDRCDAPGHETAVARALFFPSMAWYGSLGAPGIERRGQHVADQLREVYPLWGGSFRRRRQVSRHSLASKGERLLRPASPLAFWSGQVAQIVGGIIDELGASGSLGQTV
jgi:hypothetical protein